MKKYLSLFLIVLLSCCFFSCASNNIKHDNDGRILYEKGSEVPPELKGCSEAVIMASVNLYNIFHTVVGKTHTDLYVRIVDDKFFIIMVKNPSGRTDDLIGPFKIDYIMASN